MKRRIPILGHRNAKTNKYDDTRRYPFVLSVTYPDHSFKDALKCFATAQTLK